MPGVSRTLLFQLFKYAVYALLTFNVYLFFVEEHLSARLQFPAGVPYPALIEVYASTIDTAAWVLLLLLFELETYVLEDAATERARKLMHAVRIFCYSFIVYAFYGYAASTVFVYGTSPLADDNLCTLTGEWSYAVDLDEYVGITADNCETLSDAGSYQRFNTMQVAVDDTGLADIRALAWVDLINAGIWLLVVLLLEIDVRLQEHNRFQGVALKASTAAKFVLYSILLLAAIYWGVKGDFVDFWDAFLWLVAFVFIESNVMEWRRESLEEAAAESAALPH